MSLFDGTEAELKDYLIGLMKQAKALSRSVRSFQYFRKYWNQPLSEIDQLLERTLSETERLDQELERRMRVLRGLQRAEGKFK